MNRKLLAVLLLAVSLTVALAAAAFVSNADAAEYNPYHCECGAMQFDSPDATIAKDPNAKCAEGCGENKNLTWTPLSAPVASGSNKALPSTEGNYYLTTDITVTYPTYMKAAIRLDLNGHSIKRETNKIIQVETNGSLVITDTSKDANGRIATNSVTADKQYGVVVSVLSGGSVKQLKGTLDGSLASQTNLTGGAVAVMGTGNYAMYDGTILGGKAKQGGAIFITESGKFTMNGGTIHAGNATDAGGGIMLAASTSEFTMNGGTISGGVAGHGASIANYGKVTINDGEIIGGTVSGSGGGAISNVGTGALTINGGIIKDGKSSTTDNSSTPARGGGNIRHNGGSFTMTGGSVTGGTAANGQGGGILICSGKTMTVSGNAQITGNAGNNVYLAGTNGIAIGEGDLGENARIGISMAAPGVFVSAQASELNYGYFIPDNSDTYFILENGALKLTENPGSNTVAIGSVLYPTIKDAIAEITNRDKQSVKLVQNTNEAVTITGDLYFDLNGYTLSGNITVTGGELMVFDSKTADYDVSDGTYGKITGTVTGSIKRSFVNPDNQRYLVVKTNEGYSAHRIYLAVTHSVLDSDNYSAMNYKTVFMCDEVIAKLVSDYGVTVKAEKERDYSYGTSITIDAWDGIRNNEKTTKIENFLIAGDAENKKCAETNIQVNAYITLKDDIAGNVTSAPKTRSLKQMVEGALSIWDTQLTVSPKKTLKQMYNTYNQGGFMDRWSGIEKVQQFDITSKNSIASVGYAAVKIDPIEGMFEGQENAVGLLGMGDENSRWITKVDPNAPLMAICLAVTDQDGNTVLLISVDAAGINDTAAQQVVTGITALGYGVKEGNIMIASNHQHSTPNFTAAYRKYFVSQVVEGARLALEDRKEVIGMTAQIVEVGENTFNFVRNVQYTDILGRPIPGAMLTGNHDDKNRGITTFGKTYESTADDDVQLVKITRVGDEQPIILANFQTHPHLSVDSDNKKSVAYHTATADIIGVFRNKLAEELNCKPMYFTGSSGNINAWSQIDSSKEKADLNYITQGQKLALAVKNGIQESAWISVVSESTGGVAVKTVTRKYGVMLNSVPTWLTSGKTMDQIVSYAANFWEGTYANGEWKGDYKKNGDSLVWPTNSELKQYGIYSPYHAKYIIMRSTNKATDTKEITISAVAIGDMAFVVAPYEMYDTNGMQIKAGSPYKVTFTTQQADMPTSSRVKMSNGYIPSAQSYVNGGYSVDIAQFAAGTGEKLAEDYIYILNELYQ